MGSILGLWGIFWIIFGITVVQNLLLRNIYKRDVSTEVKIVLWLVICGIAAVNIFWLNPTIINSIFSHFNIDMNLSWKQIFPISLILQLQWAPVGLDTSAKLAILWERYTR